MIDILTMAQAAVPGGEDVAESKPAASSTSNHFTQDFPCKP
jgi:hypothetical protein